jgi:hypothetical protein
MATLTGNGCGKQWALVQGVIIQDIISRYGPKACMGSRR